MSDTSYAAAEGLTGEPGIESAVGLRRRTFMTASQGDSPTMSAAFSRAAQWTSLQCGRPATFIAACVVIVVWAVTGPLFGYSDTWQLIINTGTTIVTFLMVFLIQNTQNRDMSALHLKLDELIRANQGARNKLLTLEDMTEEELKEVKSTFSWIADNAPANETLKEVAEDLEMATEEIQDASEKVGALANVPLKIVRE
jgi:low affinity Fe/Cu permease